MLASGIGIVARSTVVLVCGCFNDFTKLADLAAKQKLQESGYKDCRELSREAISSDLMDRRLSFRFLERYVGERFLLEPAADVLCGRLGSLGRLRLQNLLIRSIPQAFCFPGFCS